MHKYAIIVAGGKGERMGSEIPKQFLELDGKPILMHTLKRFKDPFSEIDIILALPNNQIDYWEALCKKHSFLDAPHQIVQGGKTRFDSVKNALQLVDKNSICLLYTSPSPRDS